VNASRNFNGSATFGPKNGKVPRADPADFLTKHADDKEAPVPKFTRKNTNLKPKVPPASEKPVMGLFSNKNFIKSNAISAILQA